MRSFSLFAAALGLLSGCADIAAGDYTVYRIGSTASESSASCLNGVDPDPSVVEDTTDFLGRATFALYRAEDLYYLDFGNQIMAGTKTGDTYTFNGETVDIDYWGGADGIDNQETYTNEQTYSFTLGSHSIVGDFESKTTFACVGPDCIPEDDTNCTRTSTFIGTEVTDAELEYAL